MEFFKQHKTVASVAIGACGAMLFTVCITIFGEFYAPLKPFLKDQHYHHWIGKSIWSIGVFVIGTIAAYSFYHKKIDAEIQNARLISLTSIFFAAGTVILYLFFVYEYFVKH